MTFIATTTSPSPSMSQPDHNEVLLNRDLLTAALNYMAGRLHYYFGGQTVRLVVHGGVVMVLHHRLASRDATRDVDYCHRSFVAEWRHRGIPDAEARLHLAIHETAVRYDLGLDWMNAHADVALPMSRNEKGKTYDPIYKDAMEPTNIANNTVFTAPGLTLIGVSWSWAVALKLVRYQKHDPYDIAHILLLGWQMKGVQWNRTVLEGWLTTMCAAMGYSAYPLPEMEKTRNKMRHAISLIQQLPTRPASSHGGSPTYRPPSNHSSHAPSALPIRVF